MINILTHTKLKPEEQLFQYNSGGSDEAVSFFKVSNSFFYIS